MRRGIGTPCVEHALPLRSFYATYPGARGRSPRADVRARAQAAASLSCHATPDTCLPFGLADSHVDALGLLAPATGRRLLYQP